MVQKTLPALSDIYRLGSDVPLLKRLVTRSDYFFEAQKYELCERLVARCLEINPKHYWMLLRLGKLCEKSQRLGDAVEAYQRAFEAAGAPAEKVFALCSRAGVLAQLGKMAEAESLYLQAIEIKPDYPYAYTGLASIFEGLMPPPLDRIASLYRQAIEIDPEIGAWAQFKLDEIAEALEPKAAGLNEKSKPAKASRAQLLSMFSQYRLVDLFEILLRDLEQTLPYGAVLQRVFAELEKLPRDHFTAIENFYLHVADRLAGYPEDRDGVPASEEMALLANSFYDLALAGRQPLPARNYFRFLQHLMRRQNFSRAREAVIQAVIDAGDDPAVLTMAAGLMQAIDRPGVARLLLSRAMEIDSQVVARTLAEPDEEPDMDAVWLHLCALHDRANQVHAKKFVSIEKWLELEGASPLLNARRRATNGKRDDKDAQALDDVDAWLSDFFSRLGEHPADLVFDLPHYCAKNGLEFSDIDGALIHYFEEGWRNKHSVHAAFDDDHVRHQLQRHGLDASSAPPLLLFLRHEMELDLSPNTLFDAALYRDGSKLESQVSPWLHYLQGGWRENEHVSPYFDTAYFAQRTRRNSAETSMPSLLLYFCKHPLGDANRLFHAGYYAERYKDFLRGKTPLAHYLSEGAYVGCTPNPFFQPAGRSAQERIDYLKLSPAKL